MNQLPLLALGLLALLPIACQNGKFAEDRAASDTFQVQVVGDQEGDADAQAGKGEDGADKAGADADAEAGKGADNTANANDREDAGACAEAAGLNKDRIKMSGSERDLTLTTDQAFALKVSGSKNEVTVKLGSPTPGTRLSALCIFVSGNQNHVRLDIDMTVGKIFVKARGNQALIEGLVSKDGVVENVSIDAKGNKPQILMKGEGKFPSL